ncbi:hypothetical protein [Okeania sp. KiyG1]
MIKPDFNSMNKTQLRAYVIAHPNRHLQKLSSTYCNYL